jgi:hypothetical protein
LGIDADTPMALPDVFCWTKYGSEAGEGAAAILARKETERNANRGVFLWGIGNAVGPSIAELVRESPTPRVVFTPMLSRAAPHDVAPQTVARWFRGTGLDGSDYEVPEHSVVTSRLTETRSVHYALVCRTNERLIREPDPFPTAFSASDVCNLRSGSNVGASQVTSVVRRIACAVTTKLAPYRVAFAADLVEPYFVRLTEGAVLGSGIGQR